MRNLILNKSYYILLLLTVMGINTLFTTGPSSIEAKIIPISVNEKGEVLCRTRFSKNETGAQKAMKITYGYCIISTDTITQHITQVIDPDGFPDYDTFSKVVDYWNSIFNSCFNNNKLSEIGLKIKNQYHFNLCNVSPYKIDKKNRIHEFEKTKKINLKNTLQLSLNGAKSTGYYDNNKIHVLFDFGNVVILENINNENTQIGADFDYFNPWKNNSGDTKNIGFETSQITGILRIE